MKEELAASLSKRQIAELVEHDEVHAGEIIGKPSLPAGAGLALQPIYQVEDDVEAASCATADARSCDGHGEMRFAGAGSADQDGVALLGQKCPGCQTADQGLVDRRFGKSEAVQIPGLRRGRLLASGNLAMVIWYLIERACFSAISAASNSPMMRAGSYWRLIS